MDFFQSQDDARRNTKLLLAFFTLAVLSIVILTNLLILAVANYQNTYTVTTGEFHYSWQTFTAVSVVVLVLIGGGSLYRVVSLAGGGEAVAAMMEGRLLSEPAGFEERRLLNVVEEMAIASGTPVPPVYVIPDESINAFAAGYTAGDAVIGVTEGAVANLNRDQLQGVVAHEFSHILNGDMRLNIRLMGILFGIMMLAVVGRMMLGPRRAYRHSSRRGSGGAVIAIGIGLFVLGYVGKFFGGLIKAGVSRQREFLADASAVQFTRNPDGIGGALKRIGGFDAGSVLQNPNSEEMSHAFFAQGVNVMFASLMATHPPLPERIKRIDPRWDGEFLRESSPASAEAPAAAAGFAAGAAMVRIDHNDAVEGIGKPNLDEARGILQVIPDDLVEAARETYSARAVVYLLLLDRDALVRSRQVDHLKESADVFVMSRFREILPLADELEPAMRLPLLEMAMPALRQLTRSQYDRFKANIDALIEADRRVGLSEWALRKFVVKHLGEALDRKRTSSRRRNIEGVSVHCARLLSMLAYSDAGAQVEPAIAFEAGRRLLDIDIELIDKKALSLSRLNEAVDTLAELRPLVKPKLVKACIATITADQVVSPVEAELVRAIADSLDCPMPPIATSRG